MKNYLTYLFAALLIYSLAGLSPLCVLAKSDVSDEEYAIYSAVLSDMFTKDKEISATDNVKLVIKAETTKWAIDSSYTGENWEYIKKRFSTVMQATINDFASKNKAEIPLRDDFNISAKHLLIQSETLKDIFSKEDEDLHAEESAGWVLFHRQFPGSGGFIELSQVGFNQKIDQALIYVEHHCGSLCGTGHYLLLKKSNRKWKIVKKYMAWVS